LLESNLVPDARQARRILLASMVGTTIEFYDFYIYATAAVLFFHACSFRKAIRHSRHCNRWRRLH
jgi:hypothetical protein